MVTKKITKNTDFTITPKTKNSTYEITATEVLVQFDAGFIDSKGKYISGYSDKYYNFATKNNNDLVMTTLFTKDSGKAKTVTTTIKNYFSDPNSKYNLTYKTFKKYDDDESTWINEIIKPGSDAGINDLYSTTSRPGLPSDTNTRYYTATKNWTDFTLNANRQHYIFSQKFNNKYKEDHTTYGSIPDYIYDLSGTDEYTSNAGKLYTYDYAGKDTYTVEGANAILFANEYAGNDKYYLKKYSDFWINEYKGNDTYWVTENKSTGTNKRINDTKGDDKYYLTAATIDIVDQGGKDRYEIEMTSTVTISDSDKGNDTIIMKECSGLKYYKYGISDYSYIGNVSGNETYTLNKVSFTIDSYDNRDDEQWAIQDENGNDKYNITDSQYLAINDKKGNDTYIFNSIYDSQIADDSGKDSYNITHSNFINIDDYNNDKDKYTLTNCSFILNDFGKSSADTYNLTNVKESKIYDKGGNDKYTLKKTADFTSTEKIHIYDYAGKDTYNLSGYSHDNNMLIQINDNGTDNDTYNLKYITAPWPNSGVFDNGGKDTYKITDCDSIYIRDSGEYKDTYNITNTDKFSIYDNGETSDSYTVNNSNGYIADHNGDNDTLNIKGANKSDIIFMTEIDSSGSLDSSHCLFAYNKLNERYTIIVNFFDGNDNNYTDFGEGRIETIKVNGKTVKDINIDGSWTHFNEVKDNVVEYLDYLKTIWSSEDSISTYDVLENGSQSEINNLIAAFNGKDVAPDIC